MRPVLFGRLPSQVKNAAFIWRGRGWRVDVYPSGGTWRWHLCISHARTTVVDRVSPFEHPTAAAAVRSVSAVVRGIERGAASITGSNP
jgi:hypothetical protein